MYIDAIRKVGNQPLKIAQMIGSKSYLQVKNRSTTIRNRYKKNPNMPDGDVVQMFMQANESKLE